MKKLFLIGTLSMISFLTYSQQGPVREPAGVGRTPAGVSSADPKGPQGNNGGSTADGKSRVSDAAIKNAAEIRSINSKNGSGKVNDMNPGQKAEVIRQLDNSRAAAAAKGERENAKHYDNQSKEIKKAN